MWASVPKNFSNFDLTRVTSANWRFYSCITITVTVFSGAAVSGISRKSINALKKTALSWITPSRIYSHVNLQRYSYIMYKITTEYDSIKDLRF